MKILISVLVASLVNIAVWLIFGPKVALIEAIPGGLLIGLVIGLYPLFRRSGKTAKRHQFGPIHNGADECECGSIESAAIHRK